MKEGVCSICQSIVPVKKKYGDYFIAFHHAFGEECQGEDTVPETIIGEKSRDEDLDALLFGKLED